MRRFGRKMGNDFAHLGLESAMVFEGRTYSSIQLQMSRKEREIWEFEMDVKKSLLMLF